MTLRQLGRGNDREVLLPPDRRGGLLIALVVFGVLTLLLFALDSVLISMRQTRKASAAAVS
jgi:hypothetical protein